MSEHIGRYEEFAIILTGRGYIVSGHDHRGHGKTAKMNGIKGHFADENGFDRVVQDAYEIISHSRERNILHLRFILFGHSMGSFVARRYVQLHGNEVDMAIFSGTGGDPGASRFAGQAAAYLQGKKNGFDQPDNFLNKLVFGGFNKSVINRKHHLTGYLEILKLLRNTLLILLVEYVPTTQFFADLFKGLGKIHDADEINKIPKQLPIFLFSGSEDPVGNNGKGVWNVAKQYDKAGMEDVTVLCCLKVAGMKCSMKRTGNMFSKPLMTGLEKMNNYPEVIAIVGPTASGKTASKCRIWPKQLVGEVINGDAMQVYKGLDIGTAKITVEEMDGIPHHLFDVKEPDESFSVAEYQTEVRKWIKDIQRSWKNTDYRRGYRIIHSIGAV